MKKIIVLLSVFLFTSFVFAGNIDVKNIKWIVNHLQKNNSLSWLNLNNNKVLLSPLSKAEATLLLYGFLKLKQQNVRSLFNWDIDFYTKYIDLDKNTIFYKPALLLQALKWYDNIGVLPCSRQHPIFDPLHHVTKFEFIKMLIELINARKGYNHILSNKFVDFNKLTKEQQIYFSTALKYWIRFSNWNEIEPNKKLTVYDALLMLNDLKNYDMFPYKHKPTMLELLLGLSGPSTSSYWKTMWIYSTFQRSDPTDTWIKITWVKQVLSGNCMRLLVKAKTWSGAKTNYVWNTDFGYFKKLTGNNSDILFCPSTKKPIYDYHIIVNGGDGFMHFDKYEFFIKRSKFKYIRNIWNENSKSLKFNISLKLKNKVLTGSRFFHIFMTWWLFENNLRIWLEGVSAIINLWNKKYYINNVNWNNKEIRFYFLSGNKTSVNNAFLDVIYATNYKFGHKIFKLITKPHYIISWKIEKDDEWNYPKCIFINNKKIEVHNDWSFLYITKNSWEYTIKVNNKHYKIKRVKLTNNNSKVNNIYIAYMKIESSKNIIKNNKDVFEWKIYWYLTYSKCFNLNQGWRFIDLMKYKKDYCFFLNDYINKRVFYSVNNSYISKSFKNMLKPYIDYPIYLSWIATSAKNLSDWVFPRCENCRIYKLIKINNIKVGSLWTRNYLPKFKTLITYNQYLELENMIEKYLKKKLDKYKTNTLKYKYLWSINQKIHKFSLIDTSSWFNIQLYYILDSITKAVNNLILILNK